MTVELLIIAAIAVLLFGANKLPALANSLGRSTKEFERGHEQTQHELEELRNQ